MIFKSFMKKDKIKVLSPVKGKIVSLSTVPDPVFSGKMLGDGFAVIPEDGLFVSPIDGVIETIFPTGHAFGIKDQNGFEVLVHIGMDTVQMAGEGFHSIKSAGDKVKAGDPIVQADIEKIGNAGLPIISAVIFLNQDLNYEFTIKDAVDSVEVKINR